jgi:hypothetical protein
MSSRPRNTGWDCSFRTIGIERAKAKIGLANIAFNFKRFLYWESRLNTA